jgi:hypothetical protein
MAQVPLSFEANQGQTDGVVKFFSRGDGYALFPTPTEAVFTLHKVLPDLSRRKQRRQGGDPDSHHVG